ncbi:MAG: ATP-dependent DNA helicase DinG [Treponema sp.]|jgi:ATP-dependent DNA helicase DinG|nr:ATP-dependent DNA helicase DinG [Treponema sp.]
MESKQRFTASAARALRDEIAEAGGNEVFAAGWLDEEGRVERVAVGARGNSGAVLARDAAGGREGFESDWDSPPDVYIHNHPSGALEPSSNDLHLASMGAKQGIGAFIVDNEVTRVYVIAEPVRRRQKVSLDEEEILGALQAGGAVAQRLPSYEPREAQLGLMRLVIAGFNNDALVAAEAGTGVGKSFAYLLPALRFAAANNERVVISTATITLQQQLFEKDIPLVQKALKVDTKAVLVKGRGNYLCLRRLDDAFAEGALDDEERQCLDALQAWARTDSGGSRSSLSFVPPESVWQRVCSDADLCMGMGCPARERCFVMRLRKEASEAGIIVVNHHLLFADLAAKSAGAGYDSAAVLPPFRRVIVDEAHTIEDSATSFFSQEMSRMGVFRQLGRLYRRKRAGRREGLLPRLAAYLPTTEADALFGGPDGGAADGKAGALIQDIRDAAETLDRAALELCGAGAFRLVPAREAVLSDFLFPHFAALRKKLSALVALIKDMLETTQERDEAKSAAYQNAAWEIKAIVRRLEEMLSLCGAFLEFVSKPDDVLWMEKRTSRNKADAWVVFTQTPLNLAPALRESLFNPAKTAVCLSATLTSAASFDYWASRSGFALAEDRERLCGVFPSPFPYERAVLLAVPESAPLPGEAGFTDFVNEAAAALAETAGGSALVLFTSYEALLSAWEAGRERLEEQGIRVLKQGDDDRGRLLQTFLTDESSVLFATDSFWEGVDAPGDTLRLVILCRLPFRSPNDPVFEARCERIEAAGGSAFMQLSVPEAVVKFKQGFGRLMRRSSDHGVVAVLDARILKKRYGAFFLRSLPQTRTCFGDMPAILRAVEGFLF